LSHFDNRVSSKIKISRSKIPEISTESGFSTA